MSRSVASVIAGSEVPGAPGGQFRSVNPALVSEVVAEVALGDAKTFAEAARAARAAQRSWSDVPAPVRGRAIANLGRLVEANAEALTPDTSFRLGD
jgi:alpha-ketoglutaric semialdehyde dehydrogenase